MTLRPIERTAPTSTPPYPARKSGSLRRAGRWALRVGAVALASTTIWLAGCDLFSPRLGGDVAGPSYEFFACTEGAGTDWLVVPGTYSGELCEQGKYAWASFDVAEPTVLEVGLGGAGAALDATAYVIDPTGVVVAEVPVDGEFVTVDATPGSWRIAVAAGPTGASYQPFEITLQEADED
jgi:hypothetical protein